MPRPILANRVFKIYPRTRAERLEGRTRSNLRSLYPVSFFSRPCGKSLNGRYSPSPCRSASATRTQPLLLAEQSDSSRCSSLRLCISVKRRQGREGVSAAAFRRKCSSATTKVTTIKLGRKHIPHSIGAHGVAKFWASRTAEIAIAVRVDHRHETRISIYIRLPVPARRYLVVTKLRKQIYYDSA